MSTTLNETRTFNEFQPVSIEAGLHVDDGLEFEIRVVDERGRLVEQLEAVPVSSYREGLILVDRFRLRYGADRVPYDPALAERLAQRSLAA